MPGEPVQVDALAFSRDGQKFAATAHGAAFVWGPDGNLLASAQDQKIQEEMIVATLDAAGVSMDGTGGEFDVSTDSSRVSLNPLELVTRRVIG